MKTRCAPITGLVDTASYPLSIVTKRSGVAIVWQTVCNICRMVAKIRYGSRELHVDWTVPVQQCPCRQEHKS
jgi:hypothetical protein